MKRKFRKYLYCLALLIMGSIVIESDIITGRHNAEHLQRAAVHYFEEPKNKEEDDEDELDSNIQ